jgi:hypothetical protein
MAKLMGGLDTDQRWSSGTKLPAWREEEKYYPLELPGLISFIPNGLNRGSLVEITGAISSGKTSTSIYILAESISMGETCACVDLNNQFDPYSLAQSGICLGQLSWVRCQGNTEHAIRAADLLLHAGGFGVVLLDLCGASSADLNRIPLSYWFRFRRAIEDTPTILLICGEHPQARSCSRHSFEIRPKKFHWTGEGSFGILRALESIATPRKAAHAKVTSIRPESLLIPTEVA